jgi:hypothetical protein
MSAAGKNHLDALFNEGLIGRPVNSKQGPGALKPKGALAKTGGRRKALGPLQTVSG